jgi:RHS repeat-associated protein
MRIKQRFAEASSRPWLPTVLLVGLFGVMGLVAPAQADTQIRVTAFEYTAQGQLSKETQEPGTANLCLQTSYSYDLFGNKTTASTSACAGATGSTIVSATTPRTSNNNYSTDGRFPVSSSNALGQSETKAFDARFGVLTSLTGPNGLTTAWAYDNFGRKTQETRSDGTYTTWAYKLCAESGANCPASVGGATSIWVAIEQSYAANAAINAPEKRQYIDGLGRVIRVQTQGFDGTGGIASAAPTLVQDTEYTALGQIARQSNTYALTGGTPVWTSYTYDPLGRVLTESRPDSAASGGIATTLTSYSALSTTVTNANGQTKTTLKNAQGLVASVTDAQGNTLGYSYDAAGNLVQTNAMGSITTLAYDLRGRKTAMQDPSMGSWTYAYNAFGELVSQRDSLNQTTTLAYDQLGRMTRRTEPDLISEWSYDTKFDTTACGKGIGKLCEAKTDNGYNRAHSYDSLGRLNQTATVLDNPATPATVSETFDANTGRITSKTWPTGYQASYSYSALGYLTGVTGGGTNGFTQTTSYQVLAMNAQGQITQYKLGGKVTTVKTFDTNTQRLSAQTATTDGQATGNILSQTYSYDALGNLLSRADNSPSVGTQENFSYDSLNRLSMVTLLGGAVSPPSATQVMYDPRGNITYKSDVGRYWYDPARPNRMTNVTLETAPAATIPLSGTRALSYAFDDYSAGAQTVNSTTVGNGNLTYTVSQDTTNSRHTVRYETYTSFNMPLSMTYSNFAANATSCPPGYTLGGGTCNLTSNTANPATPVYSCPAGQTLTGTTCTLTTTSAATPNYACAAGFVLNGTNCVKTTSYGASPVIGCSAYLFISYDESMIAGCYRSTPRGSDWVSGTIVVGYSCPAGSSLSGSSCTSTTTVAATIASYSCPGGQVLSGMTCALTSVSSAAAYPATANYACPSGYAMSGTTCSKSTTLSATPTIGCPENLFIGYDESMIAGCYRSTPRGSDWVGGTIVVGYTCPSAYTLGGTSCNQTLTQAATLVNYTCPVGRNLVGTGCVLPGATFVGYACTVGTLNGNSCVESRPLQVAPGSANAADRTLAYIYGPEHQRVRENVVLSGNGTSSYFAGNTWYLNGEDSLGLSYEKEVRANGTTEHKHYVSAQGVTFALFTSRTGTLNGLPATSTSYFQQDHLGSISAMTDEAGVLTERLAYDPWGKRRYINTNPGNPDNLDALVGIQTNRGYTEHEHLDEIGVIHMNGRVYDPLMGRFMSADPNVFHPYNLKDFNRYSYVWNNPLKMFDPTGYIAQESSDSDGRGSFSWSSFFSSLFSGWGSNASPKENSPQTEATNGAEQVGTVPKSFTAGREGSDVAGRTCDACSSGNSLGVAPKNDESSEDGQQFAGIFKRATITQRLQKQEEEGARQRTHPPRAPDIRPIEIVPNLQVPGGIGPKRIGEKPALESNPKHHPNSVSPEPAKVDELYDKSVADSRGVRWAKDEKGEINRFSKPSNGATHWNGTTDPTTVDPIQPQNIPNEIKKLLGYK